MNGKFNFDTIRLPTLEFGNGQLRGTGEIYKVWNPSLVPQHWVVVFKYLKSSVSLFSKKILKKITVHLPCLSLDLYFKIPFKNTFLVKKKKKMVKHECKQIHQPKLRRTNIWAFLDLYKMTLNYSHLTCPGRIIFSLQILF